ncbi:MAG: hypothetical protein ACHQZR_00885 [Candidatus Limnocylindrales bacterium]
MRSTTPAEAVARPAEAVARPAPASILEPAEEALEFVRFCRRRRRVAWPELYDEMCAVAGRRAYRGWGFGELADHGIGFTLSDMPGLAALVRDIVREERAD